MAGMSRTTWCALIFGLLVGCSGAPVEARTGGGATGTAASPEVAYTQAVVGVPL